MAQDGPNMAQDSPKMVPQWPKMAQDAAKFGPKIDMHLNRLKNYKDLEKHMKNP